jgi:hypothetical protein
MDPQYRNAHLHHSVSATSEQVVHMRACIQTAGHCCGQLALTHVEVAKCDMSKEKHLAFQGRFASYLVGTTFPLRQG